MRPRSRGNHWAGFHFIVKLLHEKYVSRQSDFVQVAGHKIQFSVLDKNIQLFQYC